MYYPLNKRFLKASLLMLLLIFCAGLIGGAALLASPATAATSSQRRAPVRLRLKVDNGTLRAGQATRVQAEFLNLDYQPVPSDGARLIEFGIAAGGSGTLSPQQVTARLGDWTADATFASGQPGKVIITARTAGLDSAQTMVVVVRPAASLLSRLFEPVAYAAFEGFQLYAEQLAAPANNHARVPIKITFNEAPAIGTKIRLSINPPAVLVWGEGDQDRGTVTDIRMPDNEAMSAPIHVVSGTANEFDVKALVLPGGPEQHLRLTFTPPHPTRIVFGDSLPEIGPYKTEAMVCVKLADDSRLPLIPDKPRIIRLSSEDPVEFDPPTVDLSPRKDFVESKIRLKGFPVTGQLTLLAKYDGEDSLLSGEKVIVVRSAVDKVIVTGPSEVTRGSGNAEFAVRLADKDGKARTADWDRKIELSATSGKLIPNQVTIARGQDVAKVRYMSSGSAGKDVIKAESAGLTDGSLQITLVTAVYWLVTFALVGGLIGGVVRLIPAGDKLEQVLPRWTADNLQLLAGRIAGSVVGGLFLYLTVKFGISQLMGSPTLPASLDLGTRLAAFFFGGIGGFAGTLVLDRLVSWFLPAPRQGAPQHG